MEVTDIVPVVRERLIEVLTNVNPSNNTYSVFDRRVLEKKSPAVMFVIGANGMGKTTSIGKMAGDQSTLQLSSFHNAFFMDSEIQK